MNTLDEILMVFFFFLFLYVVDVALGCGNVTLLNLFLWTYFTLFVRSWLLS